LNSRHLVEIAIVQQLPTWAFSASWRAADIDDDAVIVERNRRMKAASTHEGRARASACAGPDKPPRRETNERS